MDTRAFYKGLIVEAVAHLNQILGPAGLIETAIDNLSSDYAIDGVLTGLSVTQHAGTPDMTVDVSTGTAYDGNGKRCYVGTGQNVDLSGVTLPTSGKEKWVSIFIENTVSNSEAWVDDDNTSGYWKHDDSFSITFVEGAEATPPATRPSLSATKRLLADVLLVNGMSQILNADIDTDRREDSRWDGDKVDIDGSGWSTLDSTVTDSQSALDDIDAKIIDRSAITGGYTLDSAQILTRTHPLHIGQDEENGGWAYQLNTSLGGDTIDTWYLDAASGSGDLILFVPLLVPDGAKWLSSGGTTWVKAEVWQASSATAQMSINLRRKTYTGGDSTSLQTATLASFGSWQELTITVPSDHTIATSTDSYYLKIVAGRDTGGTRVNAIRSIKWAVSITDLGRAVGM